MLPEGNSVNDGIDKDTYLDIQEKLTLPSVDALANRVSSLGSGCKLFKLDLQWGYRQLFLDPKDICWVGYVFKGKFYFDCTLSMGSKSNARCCQMVTYAAVFIHTKYGYFLINYLDDLGGCEQEEIAEDAFKHLQFVLTSMGLKAVPHKTIAPCTNMVFLGIEVNMVTMTLLIPEAKWREIQVVLKDWESKVEASLKDVQKLAGLLNFTCRCVKSGRVYLSRILNFLRQLNRREVTTIPRSVKLDIKWWREFAHKFNGVSLITDVNWSVPDVVVSSDSCLEGGGGYAQGDFFHAKFPRRIVQLNLNINQLECIVITLALKLWSGKLKRKKIKMFCDNQVTVSALQACFSRDTIIQKCLRTIHQFTAWFSFKVKQVFLQGEKNRISDTLSLWFIHSNIDGISEN